MADPFSNLGDKKSRKANLHEDLIVARSHRLYFRDLLERWEQHFGAAEAALKVAQEKVDTLLARKAEAPARIEELTAKIKDLKRRLKLSKDENKISKLEALKRQIAALEAEQLEE